MKKKTRIAPPVLSASPFAPLELVDKDNLSPADRKFLTSHETIIETGRKTFIEVATALRGIRDYKGGALYKDRYGTFEAYCQERWDFGRAHAYRLIDAAKIYSEMSPRGDKRQDLVLPTTEKQLRALGRLPTPALRETAWRATVDAIGENPIRARDVEKEVRAVIKSKGLAAPKERRIAKPVVHRITAGDLAKIRSCVEKLRAAVAKVEDGRKIDRLLNEIEALVSAVG